MSWAVCKLSWNSNKFLVVTILFYIVWKKDVYELYINFNYNHQIVL
jgi:hypothetical protein